MEKLLIVDDERHIAELIELYATQAGYLSAQAHDGESALAAVEREQPDLIVLDLMLPKLNGFEVCKRIRQKSDVPIVMLTARTDDIDKIVGLEIGADDYLTKPFNPRELMARIKAILRRVGAGPMLRGEGPLRIGALEVDGGGRAVHVAGKPVKLRAKEFDLLTTLIEHKGQVLTREKLLEIVWGFDFAGETRTVDVHVAQLRKHIDGAGVEIETVFGVGYKLRAPHA
jgi:two-component system, OmpR family, alkaline phosphatase synthesis response regulator PhoP